MLSKITLVSVALVLVSALGLVSADDRCDECKKYVNLALNAYKQNGKGQVLALIESQVCPQLGEHADLCVELVKTRGANLVALLSNADPAIVCGLIGRCENTVQFKLKVSDYIEEAVCVENLNNAKQAVSDHSLQQLAKDRLRALCPLLGAYAPQCSASLEIYWPLLSAQLSVIDPVSICSQLNTLVIDPEEILKLVQLMASEKLNSKEFCFPCLNAVTLINNRLGAQTDRAVILGYLSSTASLLPAEYAPIAANVINMYGNTFIDLVVNNQICHTLELC